MMNIKLSTGKPVVADVFKGEMERGAYNEFKAVSDVELTQEEAKEIQIELGFHPQGYGFYSFKCVFASGRWVSTWVCAVHCD